LAEACWLWRAWKRLYLQPTSPTKYNTIELMKSAAPAFFFSLLRPMLLNTVILHICKITDPPSGGKQKMNLSLERMAADAPPDPKTQAALTPLLNILKIALVPFKNLRNWMIAHDDFGIATGTSSAPKITDTQIDEVLDTAIQIMNLLDPNYSTTSFGYKDMSAQGDVDSLISALDRSHKYIHEQRGRRPDNFILAEHSNQSPLAQ